MAGAIGGRVLIAMLLVLGLLHNAAATVYPVGASGGWTDVTSGESYDEQFNNTNLVVGDVLSFVFGDGDHNVLEVPAADVTTCNTASATQTFNSSVNITLTTTGSHGFICGFPEHCDSGMHLLVTVNAAAAPGAAPVASPVASPVTSPVASPVAAPKSSPPAPPAPPTTAPAAPAPAPEELI